MTDNVLRLASSRERVAKYEFEGEGWLVVVEAETPDLAKRRLLAIADAWRPPRRSLRRWLADLLWT